MNFERRETLLDWWTHCFAGLQKKKRKKRVLLLSPSNIMLRNFTYWCYHWYIVFQIFWYYYFFKFVALRLFYAFFFCKSYKRIRNNCNAESSWPSEEGQKIVIKSTVWFRRTTSTIFLYFDCIFWIVNFVVSFFWTEREREGGRRRNL